MYIYVYTKTECDDGRKIICLYIYDVYIVVFMFPATKPSIQIIISCCVSHGAREEGERGVFNYIYY